MFAQSLWQWHCVAPQIILKMNHDMRSYLIRSHQTTGRMRGPAILALMSLLLLHVGANRLSNGVRAWRAERAARMLPIFRACIVSAINAKKRSPTACIDSARAWNSPSARHAIERHASARACKRARKLVCGSAWKLGSGRWNLADDDVKPDRRLGIQHCQAIRPGGFGRRELWF